MMKYWGDTTWGHKAKDIEGSALTSRHLFPSLRSHKLSIWPPCGRGSVFTDGMKNDLSRIPAFKWIQFPKADCSCYLSSSITAHYYLFRMLFVRNPPVFCFVAMFLASGANMVVTFRVFRTLYKLWRPDWLVASVNGSLKPFTTSSIAGRTEGKKNDGGGRASVKGRVGVLVSQTKSVETDAAWSREHMGFSQGVDTILT